MVILLPLVEIASLIYRVLTPGLTNSRIKRKFGIRQYSPFLCREKKCLWFQKNAKIFCGILPFVDKKGRRRKKKKKKKRKSLPIRPEVMFQGWEGMDKTTRELYFFPWWHWNSFWNGFDLQIRALKWNKLLHPNCAVKTSNPCQEFCWTSSFCR